METLPKEIILLILEELPITGKRNLIRCNKELNKLRNFMNECEKIFNEMINEINYLGSKVKLEGLEKYTLEIVYDGYSKLMLPRYIIKKNKILYEHKRLYFNSASRNLIGILEILINCNKKYKIEITNGAANGGHLEVLQWARQNGCECNSYTCAWAALNGARINVLCTFIRSSG